MKYSCFYACFSPTKKGLRRVRVLFDFQARNSKELTVQKGEEVAVRKTSCLVKFAICQRKTSKDRLALRDNKRGYFTSCVVFFRARQWREKMCEIVKCPLVLSRKTSKKRFFIPLEFLRYQASIFFS